MAETDLVPEQQAFPSPSPEQQHHQGNTVWTSSPPKRPAGRTKFKETRHPVYRGMRRRGGGAADGCARCASRASAGSVSGSGRTSPLRRLRAPTTPPCSRSAACLNFADSEWLLAVRSSSALSSLADVRRAALQAVSDLLNREAADVAAVVPCVHEGISSLISASSPSYDAATVPCVDEVISSLISASSPSYDDDSVPCVDVVISTSSSSYYAAEGMLEVPDALDSDMFELDMSGETDLGAYYAILADELDIEPPSPRVTEAAYWYNGGGDNSDLWCY